MLTIFKECCFRMKINPILLPLLFIVATANSADSLTLEQRIQALENQQDSHGLLKEHSTLSERFVFSGFGSFSASQLTENAKGPSGETDRLSVDSHSMMGLQLEVQLSPTTRTVGQIVAEGNEDFTPEIEWLFIEQQLHPSTAIKIGRFGYPVYSESSNGKVAYSYPTVALNDEVYIRSLVESIDGISLDSSYRFANWGTTLTVYGGERDVEKNREMLKVESKGVYGFSLEAYNGPWDFQVGWHLVGKSTTFFYNIDISSSNPTCTPGVDCFLVLPMKNKQWQASAKYQNGDWYIAYEGSTLSSDNAFVGDILGQSLTLAYSIETIQPYLQWGAYSTKLDSSKVETQTNNRQQQSLTFGVRHDFQPNVSLKYQAKYIYGLEDSYGLFNYYSADPVDFDDAWVFDISLQFAFNSLL